MCTSQNGSTDEVRENTKEETEEQLGQVRNTGVYAMLKHSSEDQLAADNKDMKQAKANQVDATGRKTSADADLGSTQSD